jgi:hypothetical protein
MKKDQEFQNLMNKVTNAKEDANFDLSSDEDLSIAIMNLISIEEHFFFTAVKTDKKNYLDLLNQVRQMRKALMKKLVKNPEGEVWCIAKHLLASSMRLMEVGTKALDKGDRKEAEDLFQKSFELYSLFWAVNFKLVDLGNPKKVAENKINIHDEGSGFLGKFSDIVKRVIDCCKE